MPDILKPSCTAAPSGGLRRSKWKKPALQQILRQWNIPTDRYARHAASFWATPKRATSIPPRSRKKRGA